MSVSTIKGPLLCIDTSIPTGSVAVMGGGLATRTRTGPNYQAENLFVVLRSLLDECGIGISDLAGVAVACGPGSFTGLRIAASTAKTLAWTAGVPLFAAGSLLCQAARARDLGLTVCAAFDAGRDEFYAACYRWNAGDYAELLAPGAFELDSLCALLEPLAAGGLVMLGQGFVKQRGELEKRLGGRLHPVENALHQPDATMLGELVLAHPRRYLVEKVGAFEPDYIRFGQTGLRLGQ